MTKIKDFAKQINKELKWSYDPLNDQTHVRFSAILELKAREQFQSNVSSGLDKAQEKHVYGTGYHEDEALESYCNMIKGKTLLFNYNSAHCEKIEVPEDLTC